VEKRKNYPKLPKISNNQVSETVATKIPPTKELSTKNSGRTSRPRSTKIDDKKSIAKLRDTSKNYIFIFLLIIIVFTIITSTTIIIITATYIINCLS